MKRSEFITLMTLAVACVCLTLVTIVFAWSNQKLQAEVQAQQAIINKGALSQQVVTNLVREIAAAAEKDDKMRQLLENNGMALSPAPSPAP